MSTGNLKLYDIHNSDNWLGQAHNKLKSMKATHQNTVCGHWEWSSYIHIASSLVYACLVLWWLLLWKSFSHSQKWYCLPALSQISPFYCIVANYVIITANNHIISTSIYNKGCSSLFWWKIKMHNIAPTVEWFEGKRHHQKRKS